jgi:hypothetical protein
MVHEINEATTLEKAESELEEFNKEKFKMESLLKEDLAKAKAEYDDKINKIERKYNVTELLEKIKRHVYVIKLLKGEVAVPYDLSNSGKINNGGEHLRFPLKVPEKFSADLNFTAKIAFALNAIKQGTAVEIKAKIRELDPHINQTLLENLNQRLSAFYVAGNIKVKGKAGKKYIYSIY